MNWNILNRPICFITSFYDWIVYGIWSSGHIWCEQEDGSMICEICNKVEE